MFLYHEVGEEAGCASVSFAERVYEEQFGVDACDVADECVCVAVCLRKFVQEVALQLGHGLVDVYGRRKDEAAFGHVDTAVLACEFVEVAQGQTVDVADVARIETGVGGETLRQVHGGIEESFEL